MKALICVLVILLSAAIDAVEAGKSNAAKPACVHLTDGKVLHGVLVEKTDDGGAWVTVDGQRFMYTKRMIEIIHFQTADLSIAQKLDAVLAENQRLKHEIRLLKKEAADYARRYGQATDLAASASRDRARAVMEKEIASYEQKESRENVIRAEEKEAIERARIESRPIEDAPATVTVVATTPTTATPQAGEFEVTGMSTQGLFYVKELRSGARMILEPKTAVKSGLIKVKEFVVGTVSTEEAVLRSSSGVAVEFWTLTVWKGRNND